MTNKERIQEQKLRFFSGRLMALLPLFRDALYEAIKQPMWKKYGDGWETTVLDLLDTNPNNSSKSKSIQDPQSLLKILVFLDCDEYGLNHDFAEFYSVNPREYTDKVHSAIRARNAIVHGSDEKYETKNIRSLYNPLDNVLRPLYFAGGSEFQARYDAFIEMSNATVLELLKSHRYCTVAELSDNSKGITEIQIREFFRGVKALDGDVVLNFSVSDALNLLYENYTGDTGDSSLKEESTLDAEERILASESTSEKVALASRYLETGHRVEVAKAIVNEACRADNPEALFLQARYLANNDNEKYRLFREAIARGNSSAIDDFCVMAYQRNYEDLFWAVRQALKVGYSSYLLVVLFLNVSLEIQDMFNYLDCKAVLDSFADPEYADEISYYRCCLEVKASDNPLETATTLLDQLSADGNAYASVQKSLLNLSQMDIEKAKEYTPLSSDYCCVLSNKCKFTYSKSNDKWHMGLTDYNDFITQNVTYSLSYSDGQPQIAENVVLDLISDFTKADGTSSYISGKFFDDLCHIEENLDRHFNLRLFGSHKPAEQTIENSEFSSIKRKYNDTILPFFYTFNARLVASNQCCCALKAIAVIEQLLNYQIQYYDIPYCFLLEQAFDRNHVPQPILENLYDSYAKVTSKWTERVNWFKELDRQLETKSYSKDNALYQARYYREKADVIISMRAISPAQLDEAIELYEAAKDCGEDVPESTISLLKSVRKKHACKWPKFLK